MSVSSLKLPSRFSTQSILWAVLLIVATVTIALNAPELRGVVNVWGRGSVIYIPFLIGLEAIFVVNMGLFYASTFRAGGLKADRGRFVLISAAAHFLNLVSKSSGFAGLSLFLKEGERNGDSSIRVTAAYLAAYALGYAAFLVVLILSLVMLYLRGSLTRAEEIASAVLFALVSLVAALLIAGLRSQKSLNHLIVLFLTPANLLFSVVRKRPLVNLETIEEFGREMHEAVHFMLKRPRKFLVPFGHALLVELLSVCALYAIALSLHAEIGIEQAIAGYALSLLFSILSVTPAGLGFVEASLAVFLVSVGMDRHEAVAVTLGFRVFDFWLPTGLGMLCAFYLRARPQGSL